MTFRSSAWLFCLVLAACGGGGGGGSGQQAPISVGGGGGAPGGGGGAPGGGGLPSPGFFFTFDTGLGGSGGLIGSIGGFGSVIVNDREMETDDAAFFIEGLPGSQADLHEGMLVVVTGDIGELEAEEVYYRSNIKGPVSAQPVISDPAVGSATLTVLGQTVRTNAATILNGVDLLALSSGDLLEVSGSINSAGEVVATYVELLTSLSEYKAIGVVAGLDTVLQSFDLAGLEVDYGSAVLNDFDGQPLANGQLVEVRLNPSGFTAPASALAGEVELLPSPSISEGAEVETEGVIDFFASATDFRVNGIPITTDADTEYEDGSSASLAANVRVEVEGTANADGVVVAEEVKFKQIRAVRAEGSVSAVDVSAGSITSLGVTFQIRPFTELEDDSAIEADPFTLANVQLGDRVEVRGFVSGAAAIATELEREDPETAALLRGPVSGFDATAGTIEIFGVNLVVADGITDYQDDDDSLSRSEFFALLELGEEVTATWDDFGSLADPVDQLELEEED